MLSGGPVHFEESIGSLTTAASGQFRSVTSVDESL